MGRAIVREPSVFPFDEPLSNLVAKLRVQMRLEIKKLQHGLGVTSVYVTHDQVEAMTLGHRPMVLNAGVVAQPDSPIELYERPASVFVAGFIGSPAMNFLAAYLRAQVIERLGADTLIHGHFGSDRTDLTVCLRGTVSLKPDETLPLRVAPEHLHLFDPAGGARLDTA